MGEKGTCAKMMPIRFRSGILHAFYTAKIFSLALTIEADQETRHMLLAIISDCEK